MTFQIDTSGYVLMGDREMVGRTKRVLWSDLDPFTQGYVEAALTDLYRPEARGWTHSPAHGGYIRPGHLKPGTTGAAWDDHPSDVGADEAWDIDSDDPLAFHMIAPETLARIIADCEAFKAPVRWRGATDKTGGRFWKERQRGLFARHAGQRFPPLTVSLGDDGKVRFQ